MSSQSVVVITHTKNTRLGWLSQYLSKKWGNIIVLSAFEDEFPNPQTLRFPVVVMGGPMGVEDIPSLPWLAREVEWISKLMDQNHPYLGVCLGAQLMAHALGHTILTCDQGTMECGYYPTANEGLPCHVYHWHQDGIYLTSQGCQQAKCLGSSNWKNGKTTQALQRGPALGVQFHPEVDADLISTWVRRDAHDLSRPMARPAPTHLSDHERFGAQQRVWLSGKLDELWQG